MDVSRAASFLSLSRESQTLTCAHSFQVKPWTQNKLTVLSVLIEFGLLKQISSFHHRDFEEHSKGTTRYRAICYLRVS